MKHTLVYAAALLVLAAGCAQTPRQETDVTHSSSDAGDAPAQRFAGTLRGGIIAVGAETTGWALERDGGTRIDVDVSKVSPDVVAGLDGKPVVIHGAMTTANWPERGEKLLLVAERIEAE